MGRRATIGSPTDVSKSHAKKACGPPGVAVGANVYGLGALFKGMSVLG
jgi:hypothetical protein